MATFFPPARLPERIVCLTEEPTEILCLLGQEQRIVGVSAYSVRPPGIRRRKAVVSAFLDGSLEKIQALRPDLILGFSDMQADLAAKLIRNHLPVLILNQRSLREILDAILLIGTLVGEQQAAETLVVGYRRRLEEQAARSVLREVRPRVYFEEWPDPLIPGIQWVSELIQIAGGHDVFADRATLKGASERRISAEEVVAAAPDVVIACWCGKPYDENTFLSRPGFSELPAVGAGRVHEMDPAIILQPGPACLTDGLDALVALLAR